MKFLLVLAVVVVAIWVWRNNRQEESRAAKKPTRQASALPLAMVECPMCGTHLPENEALKGKHGAYCCAEHRHDHEHEKP